MNHTLTLSDNIIISENLIRSGNNINLIFEETVIVTAPSPDVYKIVRTGDMAFARTDYP
jgi:hypothetical protein